MCVGIPQKVVKVNRQKAIVSSGRHQHEVDISLVSSKLKRGDYILTYHNLAICKLPKEEVEDIQKFISKHSESQLNTRQPR